MSFITSVKTAAGLCLMPVLLAAASSPGASFFARRDTPVKGPASGLGNGGAAPSGVVVADFNGDGLPDAAVLSQTDNTLIVMLSTARRFSRREGHQRGAWCPLRRWRATSTMTASRTWRWCR